MFIHIFELSIGIKAGTLVVILLPKCDPRPCVVVAVMENTMLNCSLSICENDSRHMSEGCFTNDLEIGRAHV